MCKPLSAEPTGNIIEHKQHMHLPAHVLLLRQLLVTLL
jgi:hypothetical protein